MRTKLERYLPIILSSIGAVGVIGTAIMSAKETPKALILLEEAENDSETELTNIEKIKIAIPAYKKTILLGVGTIACMAGSVFLNRKEQRSIATAYMLANRAYNEYRNKVVELYGEEMDEEIIEAIRIDHAEGRFFTCDSGFGFDYCVNDFENMEKKALFYDELSDRYFEKAPVDVVLAEYHLNRNLNLRGEVDVNMFYYYLGLDPIDGGDDLIWIPTDYYTWIDFSHPAKRLSDGRKCYLIHMPYEPLPIETLEEYYC